MEDTNGILDNMFITESAENVSGFNYTGFTHRKDKWVIMREEIATGHFRYALGSQNFETAWTNKASQTYVRVDQLS